MRRKLAVAVAGLLVVGGSAIALVVAGSSATAATTLTVIEHYGKTTYIDLVKPGYSQGTCRRSTTRSTTRPMRPSSVPIRGPAP